MDYEAIKQAAQGYEAAMTKFLRDIVSKPGESCGEKDHIDRIAAEMKALEFDDVQIDKQGNVLGYMGTGKTLIAFDAHIDTVGIGNIANWKFDPYEGYETETEIGGRGVSDQCGGLVSAVYGARIMKDLDLVHVMPVAEFQDIVIAGNRFSELQNRTLSLEELCMHPLVSMESGTTTRLFWDNLFEEQGLDLRPSIEVSSNDLIAPTVSHNLGIGFVPSEFARNYLLNYRVFQLHLNITIPKRQILVLQNPMRPLTPAAQAFLDMLKQPVRFSRTGVSDHKL